VEIMLCLSVLRGSLWHLLVWVETCLNVVKDDRQAKISAEVVNMALEQIRQVTGQGSEGGGEHVARYNLARSVAGGEATVDLFEGAHCIMAEVSAICSTSRIKCSSSG
jgi:hypothetical protein